MKKGGVVKGVVKGACVKFKMFGAFFFKKSGL